MSVLRGWIFTCLVIVNFQWWGKEMYLLDWNISLGLWALENHSKALAGLSISVAVYVVSLKMAPFTWGEIWSKKIGCQSFDVADRVATRSAHTLTHTWALPTPTTDLSTQDSCRNGSSAAEEKVKQGRRGPPPFKVNPFRIWVLFKWERWPLQYFPSSGWHLRFEFDMHLASSLYRALCLKWPRVMFALSCYLLKSHLPVWGGCYIIFWAHWGQGPYVVFLS